MMNLLNAGARSSRPVDSLVCKDCWPHMKGDWWVEPHNVPAPEEAWVSQVQSIKQKGAGDQQTPCGFPLNPHFHCSPIQAASLWRHRFCLLIHVCLRALAMIWRLWSPILCFSSRLWSRLAVEAQSVQKWPVRDPQGGGEERGGGSPDGAYGNYSLIYHLGHGNSCKLGFH